MADQLDLIILTVKGVDLDDTVIEFDEGQDPGLKPVNTMNKKREIKGAKRGNNARTMSLKVNPINDPTLPSWRQLSESGEHIVIKARDSIGRKIEWECGVGKVTESVQVGDSSSTVELLPFSRRES